MSNLIKFLNKNKNLLKKINNQNNNFLNYNKNVIYLNKDNKNKQLKSFYSTINNNNNNSNSDVFENSLSGPNINRNKSSFDDIVDSQNTIEIRNVPANITTRDIWERFKDFKIVPHGIKMVFDGDSGFVYISFQNKKDFTRAVEMKSFSFEDSSYTITPIKSTLQNWGDRGQQDDNTPRTGYLNRTAVTDHLWKSRKTKDQKIVNANSVNSEQQINNQQNKSSTSNNPKPGPPLLTVKTPNDSHTEVDLFFSSDLALREMYLSPFGHLRIGRLLEDLDALAGTVSFKHTENDEDNFKKTIVTASVDRIKLLQPLVPDRDIKMEGVVTYVGKSSMEVMIKLRSKNNTTFAWEPVLVAYFTMVCRDKGKASPVNHLKVATPFEKQLFEEGEKHKESRLCNQANSLEITPPTSSELQIIHNLFMIAKKETELELIPMKDTTSTSVILCQPQERNINGQIFGGFLMRKGFELAFSCVFLKFNESLPRFVAMDDVTFYLPVEIGDILTLEATIVYSHPVPNEIQTYYAQVEVKAYVTNPYIGKKKLSNVFNFTFYCSPKGENISNKSIQHEDLSKSLLPQSTIPQTKVKQILPQTYSQAMSYLAGKRIVDRHRESEQSPDNMGIWRE